MKPINYFALIIVCFFFISGCNSVKETLSGKKKANNDEFLVKKKNPLILPPNFNELPKPVETNDEKVNEDKDLDFSGVLEESKTKKKESKQTNNSLEKSISEILKNN